MTRPGFRNGWHLLIPATLSLGLLITLGILLRNPPGPLPVASAPDEPSTDQRPPWTPIEPAVSRREEPPTFQTVADPTAVQEAFDKTTAGSLPGGWTQWSSDNGSPFKVAGEKALSAPNSLALTTPSTVTARAWPAFSAADVQASVSVYFNTLIPAELFVRGVNVKGPTPSFYAVSATRGLEVQLVRVVKGNVTKLGAVKSTTYVSEKWARITLHAKGKDLAVQVYRPDTKEYLDPKGEWVPAVTWAIRASDTELSTAGAAGLNRPARYAGTLYFDDFAAAPPEGDLPAADAKPAVAAANLPALPRPEFPRHYPHIRIAMLAYNGNPMGATEEKLLRESVDLVVPNVRYLEKISTISPKTPQMIYTNTSNLYLDVLTDWLAFADAKGLSREAAFYHAAAPKAFRGDSPSSLPVTWFWSVFRGGSTLTNVTSAVRGKGGKAAFGGMGESVYVGHPDRFREINFTLDSGAAGGWTGVLEYPSKVDADGAPTWAALTTLTDSTNGLKQSGQITFDPPADWKPAVVNGSTRLFYVRVRTTAGGTAPSATAILRSDYVGAKGGITGTVPAFDSAADKDGDGYLNDAEYAARAAGKDARFLHESRMLTESYGQMRFGTNPSNAGFRDWAVDYHKRQIQKYSLAAGFFMDNSDGKAPVLAKEVGESVGNYAPDYGVMLNAISLAIKPKWVLANTAGGQVRADPIVGANPAYFEEFAIRPLSHHYVYFEDLSALVLRRAALANPAPLAVIDSHPQNGTPTDERMLMGVLAYYYLLSDPDSTFLMFFGGYEPATAWSRHWVPAVAFDIGKPAGKWTQFATGTDPANESLSYRVYGRTFDKALVLYKPLSYARGVPKPGGLGNETATKHELKGTYRALKADGTLGEAVTTVTLRNGEGVILVKQ